MSAAPPSPMFSEPPQERHFPTTAVAIAVVAVLILVATFVMLGRRHKAEQLDASYAPNLVVSNVQVTQSDSVGGGKQTYVEGHLQNNGGMTVTAATVRVTFANDVGMAPEVDTQDVRLIRIREPEIDTEPMSHAPIAPGAGADFYLIFENVNSNWNTQPPAVKVVGVTTK